MKELTVEAAKEVIRFHGGHLEPDVRPEEVEADCLLISLRPFSGLNAEGFHEVANALRVVGEDIAADRATLAAAFDIVHFMESEAGEWLSTDEAAQLANWRMILGQILSSMLNGCPEMAFEGFENWEEPSPAILARYGNVSAGT